MVNAAAVQPSSYVMQLGVLLSTQEARVARGVASYVLGNLHNSIVALSRSPSI